MKLKLIPTILVKLFIKLVFNCFVLMFKIDESKVTFASYRSESLTGNLFFIWKELESSYPNYKCNFAFKKFNSSLIGKIDYVLHMIKACYALATSKYFIVDDYYFPIYVIKPRKGTDIIQLWHGSGALKKFGLSTIGKSYGPSKEYLEHVKIHSNYSKVYVSSSEVIPYYAEAFGMAEDKIFPLGIPRTDYFFSEEELRNLKKKFFDTYPELEGRKLLLYAPTYRGKSHYQEEFECPLDFSLMRNQLGSEYALLIHLHPYMQSGLRINEEDQSFAYHIHDTFNIQELLVLANLLITDYSTVFFDYSLLDRPIAFFTKDLKEYIEERDFYYNYETLVPGPLFNETNSLVNWIHQDQFDLKKVKDFKKRFFDYLDGKASKRIVDHFINGVVLEKSPRKEKIS